MIGLHVRLLVWQSIRGVTGEVSKSMLTELIIQFVFMFLPVFALIAILDWQKAGREERGERNPVKESLLRSPGESLRRKIEEIDDEINIRLASSIATGAVVGVIAGQSYRAGGPQMMNTLGVYLVIFLGAEIWLLRGLYAHVQERRSYRLGLSGELAVGEELNKLMLDGCRVFHDFPGGPDWNIDHVIVDVGGVYAVETKAFTKRKSSRRNQKDYEVIYTGDGLEFPDRPTKEPIEQARRNASELAKFLRSAAAEEVPVYPITIPIGWYVISKAKGPQEVMNVKGVRSAIVGRKRVLSDDQIQRICHQIEQKCRDVEF